MEKILVKFEPVVASFPLILSIIAANRAYALFAD